MGHQILEDKYVLEKLFGKAEATCLTVCLQSITMMKITVRSSASLMHWSNEFNFQWIHGQHVCPELGQRLCHMCKM